MSKFNNNNVNYNSKNMVEGCCNDSEFIEYQKYYTEKNKKKEPEPETPEARDKRMRDQFQALEEAGFIKYIPPGSPMPCIGRRNPEPEPERFEFDPKSLEYNYEEISQIYEQGEDLLWFGDPCYVVPDDLWDSFCSLDSEHQVKVNYKNLPCYFFVWSTAWGDGEYELKMNGEVIASLGVDTGMLSMIPMRLIKQWRNESKDSIVGDVLPGYFSGGYALQGYFNGKLVVDNGNMCFNGPTFNIIIPTDE